MCIYIFEKTTILPCMPDNPITNANSNLICYHALGVGTGGIGKESDANLHSTSPTSGRIIGLLRTRVSKKLELLDPSSVQSSKKAQT